MMSTRQAHDLSGQAAERHDTLANLHLEMLGWRPVEQRREAALWQDAEGDFLGLARMRGARRLPRLSDQSAVTRHARRVADGMEALLVETAVAKHVEGRRALLVICRRVQDWALVFTGILMIPTPRGPWMWTVVAKGRPATGDLRQLCDDCLCIGHPLWRVRQTLRKLLAVPLGR